MQVMLEPDEAAILKEVLATFLSDLRAEIGKTEDYGTRQELHQRELVLRKVLAQIDQG
jgi:hypothetical protein